MTTAAGLLAPAWSVTRGAPAIIAAQSDRPQALQGLQLGDPSDGSLVVWSRRARRDQQGDLRNHLSIDTIVQWTDHHTSVQIESSGDGHRLRAPSNRRTRHQ